MIPWPKEHDYARYWSIDPAVTFLNHGSFGACPTAVQEFQRELRVRMERQPVTFYAADWEPLMDQTRGALGEFLHCDPDDLAWVANATTGVNTVLRAVEAELKPGDELLTTDHAYNACKNALDAVAARAGATVVVARVPFPIDSAAQILDSVMEWVTDRTRLALLDHVTSPTGLVMPMEALIAALDARGVDALVDGAHVPGMLPLDLGALQPAYFTGNAHKWLCAPKGAGVLYVRRDRQEKMRPLVISHGQNSPRTDRSRFRLEFDWQGTDDPTAFFSVMECLRHLDDVVEGGWPALMARNHDMVVAARSMLCERLGISEPAPASMLGSLATIPLPETTDSAAGDFVFDPFQKTLSERYNIEVAVFRWQSPRVRGLRISAQLYNTRAEYERLAGALEELLGETR